MRHFLDDVNRLHYSAETMDDQAARPDPLKSHDGSKFISHMNDLTHLRGANPYFNWSSQEDTSPTIRGRIRDDLKLQRLEG